MTVSELTMRLSDSTNPPTYNQLEEAVINFYLANANIDDHLLQKWIELKLDISYRLKFQSLTFTYLPLITGLFLLYISNYVPDVKQWLTHATLLLSLITFYRLFYSNPPNKWGAQSVPKRYTNRLRSFLYKLQVA